ncbi:MAG: hypothetical protein ACYTHM_24795, partial [Planctomycetota bacterium]
MMRTFRTILLALGGIFLGIPFPAAAGQSEKGEDRKPPKVLIVAPDGAKEPGEGIQQLLKEHGLSVTLAFGKAVKTDPADPPDLILITGQSRAAFLSPELLDTKIPLLGYGYYGCLAFG